jgi:hypothetical protein
MFLRREKRRLAMEKQAAILRGDLHRRALQLEMGHVQAAVAPAAQGFFLATALLKVLNHWRHSRKD